MPDRLHFTAPLILGRTGNDLFLRDNDDEEGGGDGEPNASSSSSSEASASMPLLLRMAQEPKFLDPLRCFQYRRAYGNVRQDLLVPFGTGRVGLGVLSVCVHPFPFIIYFPPFPCTQPFSILVELFPI